MLVLDRARLATEAGKPFPDYMMLRNHQNRTWAIEALHRGYKMSHEKKFDKALKAFSHAMEIDTSCLQALVARGCTYVLC
jgi:hypothetical protein